MPKNIYSEAHTLIKESERILLATHESPDGDGIASMLAFYHTLEAIFPGRTRLWSKDEIPLHLRFLPGTDVFQKGIPDEPFDLLIAFDYGDFKRLGLNEWVALQHRLKILTIDHHPEGGQLGTVTIIDRAASSTAEIVFDFFETTGMEFKKDAARCLLCGIILDTGCLTYANATAKTFRIVKNLLSRGARIGEIIKATGTGMRPIEAIRLWGEALLRAKIDPTSGLVVSFLQNEDFAKYGMDKECITDFTSVLATVSGTRMSAFLTEDRQDPRFIKGSLRSNGKNAVDVSSLARHFSGGGHVRASGFRTSGTMKEVVGALISAARTV